MAPGFAALTALGVSLLLSQAQALSPAQREIVDRGEPLVVTERRAGSAWPAVTVYSFIDATPEQAAATFADLEAHAAYIASISKARISRMIDSATFEVDYTLKVPIVSDEDYTVRNHISHTEGEYQVNWTMVRASSTKAIVGHARFIPYSNARTGRAGTLLEYANFVTPGSRLAGVPFVRNRAAAEVRTTVESIAREVEATRNSTTLTSRVATLRRIVGPPR